MQVLGRYVLACLGTRIGPRARLSAITNARIHKYVLLDDNIHLARCYRSRSIPSPDARRKPPHHSGWLQQDEMKRPWLPGDCGWNYKPGYRAYERYFDSSKYARFTFFESLGKKYQVTSS